METWLALRPTRVERRVVFHLDLNLDDDEAERVLGALVDPVSEIGALGMLPDAFDEVPVFVTVGFRPGVTDSVGASVKRAAEDRLGRECPGRCYSSTMWIVFGLDARTIETAAAKLLYNPLIEFARVEAAPRALDRAIPRAGDGAEPKVVVVALRGAEDATLERISTERTLALSLAEMRAIAEYFREIGRDPTDAELECLAQTWSEHCKHKIFAAAIDYVRPDGSLETIERGLFDTFIRGTTQAIAERRSGVQDSPDEPFLVSVFHDNAGVVRFTEADHLAYKVETHNSPSALDPYGGAMTGIVGVNRDSFGTGLGADLLTNVWGYCFAEPNEQGPIPKGLMHPRRLRDGVHRGVVDGGNQSGIPFSRGFELFDRRFLGKPLVFCGTVAAMPVSRRGWPTHEERVAVGDKIVMVGGRIGKDGIHGATFSSLALSESSPVQAVQIGDPITQKMMFDFLAEARDAGLIAGMTDNGAGGLSSSVGEMAEATGGARIDLACAPLKYPGLQPWEILVSEAQERMTLAVAPRDLDALLALAARREVEVSVLGEFTDDGRLVVEHSDLAVVDLALQFLHDGLPRLRLRAKLDPPDLVASTEAEIAAWVDPSRIADRWLTVLSGPNVASSEDRVRRYDHEVKGLSVVKPLIGRHRDVPSTATVMRVRHGRSEGVVLGEGLHPHVSDLDAYAMAQVSVDEAVRRVLCAGARIDRLAGLDNFCWPDPIPGPKTPDGEHKLAQLVECCRGLRDACEALGLPLISGKDSMKNDATLDGVKISIPPTLLVSVMGQIENVDRSLTLVPRREGDILWLLHPAAVGLGASEGMRRGGVRAGEFPRADVQRLAAAYADFAALRDAGIVRSAHVCSRGGLAVAFSHMVLASERWLSVDVGPLCANGDRVFEALFAEGCGRIVFSAAMGAEAEVRATLERHGLVRVGTVGAATGGGGVLVQCASVVVARIDGPAMREAFQSGLRGL